MFLLNIESMNEKFLKKLIINEALDYAEQNECGFVSQL